MSSRALKKIFDIYLEPSESSDELEVRFGTKGIRTLTRVDFDNVIQTLKSKGFTTERPTGVYYLRIQNEFMDKRKGETRISNIRTEITSLSNIQSYCRQNALPSPLPSYITFYSKRPKYIDSERVDNVDYDDFNFRVALKEENPLTSGDIRIKSMLQNWNQTKKNFRFIKRFTFTHPNYPLKVDCSIVKNSNKIRGRMIPAYTIGESNLLNNLEEYEIEIELYPVQKIKQNPYKVDNIIIQTKKVIRIILGGLQQTNFPISLSEQQDILKSYIHLFNPSPPKRILPRDFIGPSSISLEMRNIIPLDPNLKVPNIRQPYTVTEKADGLRKLLYIHSEGKIFLIDTNMNVQFTGCVSQNRIFYNSLIDGEHVIHSKTGKFINLYLAFDIYFKNEEDLRPYPFWSTKQLKYPQTRLSELNTLLDDLNVAPITGKGSPPLSIRKKTFYKAEGNNIFNFCGQIINAIDDGLFEYETDGLIFTPLDKGVASDTLHEEPPPRKITWMYSLKWKPPVSNTIDFLVTTKKTATGQEFIGNLFEEGDNMTATRQIRQYKTLILRVGYDERKHGYQNPCQDLIDEKYRTMRKRGEYNSYKPIPFYPSNPSDPDAAFANIIIKEDVYGTHYMLTENSEETFEDNMIVEFRYDKTQKTHWRWIPIRVRYDKTAEYRRGLKNFGNAFHVAESVWHSIHFPITKEMLKTGHGIADILADDEVYYRGARQTNTRALRDFHNLYVKRKLIIGVSKRGQTLIDLAVGKGGDMPKWIAAQLSFILGIDLSKDNIANRKDGICARFLNYKKRTRSMPGALFIEGSSALNIRNGDAAATQQGKDILRAIFGDGPKDKEKIGAALYRQYGKGKDGFNIVSCQFATHYFFENQNILQNFLRNISENCSVGGYFIGTCYDGSTIFDALEDKERGDAIAAFKDDHKIWSIQKEYDSDSFEDNETSVGYAINVYQESINKAFREYLVNFTYLTYLLENYGFRLITREESRSIGLPNGSGLFGELFTFMENQIKEGRLKKSNIGESLQMTPDEKRISFYNRYFVFIKDRHVDTSKVLSVMTDQSAVEQVQEKEETTEIRETVETPKPKKKGKKMKKRINIKRKG